ncbi:MAG: hypothetical protein A4E53_01872 [Pelotomaculum sp. PtaB.Bin104]|nr:MAG: hypothetical protein A4E53_01872 [Pelotomaculum sp. PtaB.Bin104]
MNPQLLFLKKHNLFNSMVNLVLGSMTNNWQSSHQLTMKLGGTPVLNRLIGSLAVYKASGFREPASFVGSVSSHLGKQGRVQHSVKICPVKGTPDDVFKF